MLALLTTILLQATPQPYTGPRLDASKPVRFAYPREALARGESGRTTMTLSVSAKGRVTDCVVVVSSRSAILDEASCKRARHLRYHPAQAPDGSPIAGTVSYQQRWDL